MNSVNTSGGLRMLGGVQPTGCSTATSSLFRKRSKSEQGRDSVLSALLSPNSLAMTSPSGVRRRSLQTLQCQVPPQSAYDLANHQELCVARQCFWACIAWGFLPSGFCYFCGHPPQRDCNP